MKSSLHVDPIACDGHGLCAELLPEWIELDDWGYPIVSGEPIPPGLEKLARRAVASCPTLALKLRKERAAAAQPEKFLRTTAVSRPSHRRAGS